MAETAGMTQLVGDSDSLLRQMVERLPTVLWSTDCQLRVTSAFGADRLVALSLWPGQFAGMTLQGWLQIEDQDSPLLAAHRRALRGESVSFEDDCTGQAHQVCVAPLRDGEGGIVGCIGFRQEINGGNSRSWGQAGISG